MKLSRALCSGVIVAAMFCVQDRGASEARAQNAQAKLTWSSDKTNKTPEKGIDFYGPFSNDLINVKCDQLGTHDFIEISFDLLIMAAWDGAVPVPPNTQMPPPLGPDYVRIAIENGPTLVYASFGNVPMDSGNFRAESKAQTYPSQIPGRLFPTQAGASEYNTLGYVYPLPGPPVPIPMDATYPIKFIIAHRDPQAVVEIGGLHLQGIIDENWGVANMKVRGLRADQVEKPKKEAIASAFMTSFIFQPGQLAESFSTLISGMDDTVAWIDANVPAGSADSKEIAELIKKLINGNLEGRADASNKLRAIGHQVEPYLRDARKTVKAQQREEVDWILEALGVTPVGDESVERLVLSTRVLEVIGTPKAVALRKKLMGE